MTQRVPGRFFARMGVLATATAAAVTVLGAGVASAADKPLDFKGSFPLIGEQTVSTVVHVDVPESATIGQTVSVPFSLDADVGTAAADGLRLVGVTTLGGSIDASVTVQIGDQPVALPVSLPIPDTAIPDEGTLAFTAEGSVDFTVPEGVPAGEATTSVDPEAVTHVTTDASDPSLANFDVNLALDPADQDTVLGTTQIS
ncbi:DUF6801 domain-containing protein [Amycolatopsis jiangsuensis]|nr:DUF6801 domain-containing protein [Amycolatopsis jiangsuensis]